MGKQDYLPSGKLACQQPDEALAMWGVEGVDDLVEDDRAP
jgi:hypothetical protein